MAEEPNNFNYRQTEWRDHVNYRFDELKGDFQDVSKKVDAAITMGIVTPALLDQKLREQKESCATQFKKPDNPDDEVKNSWSLAKWGIKECGVFGALVLMNLCLIFLLMKGQGFI